jgi:hypothetical protein
VVVEASVGPASGNQHLNTTWLFARWDGAFWQPFWLSPQQKRLPERVIDERSL